MEHQQKIFINNVQVTYSIEIDSGSQVYASANDTALRRLDVVQNFVCMCLEALH